MDGQPVPCSFAMGFVNAGAAGVCPDNRCRPGMRLTDEGFVNTLGPQQSPPVMLIDRKRQKRRRPAGNQRPQRRPTQLARPLTPAEVTKLGGDIGNILKKGRCSEFIDALLQEAGDHAQNKAITKDMADLFKRVREQRGYVYASNTIKGQVVGYSGVEGSVMDNTAQVQLTTTYLADRMSDEGRAKLYAYTALGELTHIAGEKSLGGNLGSYGYGDEGLARAARIVADRMKIKIGQEYPDRVQGTLYGRYSGYYHYALEKICGRFD
jgi:hypothetical protein